MPTFGSLFAGIGGIDLGLERAGWIGRWQVEIDEYCTRVLAKHWPDIPRYGDITTVDWSGVEPVDLLAGGFPCQPISSAGRQKAQGDERWLWPEFLRAIRALRPGLVLVENVTNLLAINDGSAFGDVLGDLAASGYDAEWDCIPASFVGAPHDRDRVWIVAYPDRDRRDPESGRQGRTEGPALGSAIAPGEHGSDRLGRAVRRAGSTLADSNGVGLQGERGGWLPGDGDAPRGDDADRRGSSMADPERLGSPQSRTPRLTGHRASGAYRQANDAVDGRRVFWESQSRLGRDPDGFSGRLDQCWPASPGQPQHEWEPPRTISGRIPDRIPRLKACGNAVVPQVVEVIGRRLMELI